MYTKSSYWILTRDSTAYTVGALKPLQGPISVQLDLSVQPCKGGGQCFPVHKKQSLSAKEKRSGDGKSKTTVLLTRKVGGQHVLNGRLGAFQASSYLAENRTSTMHPCVGFVKVGELKAQQFSSQSQAAPHFAIGGELGIFSN